MAEIILTLGGGVGPTGPGVPDGGDTDQVLVKKSSVNQDTMWKTVAGVSSPVNSVNGKVGTVVIGPSDLAQDSTHRFVTDTEKSTWNAKAETSEIPTLLSQLTGDSTHRLVTDAEKATWNAGGSGGGFTSVVFTNTLPLSANVVMAQHTVSGSLAFSVSGTPALMAVTYCRLVADGTNVPTFTGMVEWGGSSGYDNTAGIVNNISFFNDGTTTYYSVTQDIGATPIPLPPGVTTVTVGSMTTTTAPLTWTLPSGGTPTDYNIQYKDSSSGTWLDWSHAPSATRSATITGLSVSTSYDFRVAGTNAGGTADWSATVSGTTADPIAAPSTPTINSATPTASQVTLAWTAGAGGGPVTDYSVQYKRNVDSTWTLWGSTFSASPGAITGLTASTLYDFQLRANGAGGNSSWTATTQATTSAASSDAIMRLETLNGSTESGNGTTGWLYTAGSTGFAGLAQNNVIGLPGGNTGTVRIARQTGVMLGLIETIPASNWYGIRYGFYLGGGGNAIPVVNGANQTATNITGTLAAYNWVRIRVVGTTGYIEAATDPAGTWDLVDTRTGLSANKKYVLVSSNNNTVAQGPIYQAGLS